MSFYKRARITLHSQKTRKMQKISIEILQFQDFSLYFQTGKAFYLAFLRNTPAKPNKTLRPVQTCNHVIFE